jgi:hypothetical protein
VAAEQHSAGERGSVSTPTDTQFSGTATYNGFNGFQPFAAMLVNMPTGKSALYGNARFARMDGDLVEIGSYGEGWNFGPTAGVNIPITPSLIATLSVGYTSRGSFDKEGPDPNTGLITATDHVMNGDDTTVTFALGYGQGPLSLQGSISEAWNQVSQVNEFGQSNFQRYRAGARTTVSGSFGYQFNPQWGVNANGYWNHSEPNDVLDAAGVALIPQASNGNSDIFRINTGLTYLTSLGVLVGPTASYMFRNHNAFDPQTFQFVPAKTRWAVGGIASYNVTNAVSLNGRIEHVWIHEDVLPGPPAFAPFVVDQSGEAWAFSLGGTINF